MRLFGFVLLIVGSLLCVSIVWATLGFLMMGFGLICLLIAERRRKRAPEPAILDTAPTAALSEPAPRPDRTVRRQQHAALLEPTFADVSPTAEVSEPAESESPAPEEDCSFPADPADAPPAMERIGDRRTPPRVRSTRNSEFDRIRASRFEPHRPRNEPGFQDFSVPLERELRQPPPPPFVQAHPMAAASVMPPPIAAAPPIVAEPRAVAVATQPEVSSIQAAPLNADRTVLFDDADDLADLFEKFDLGKDQPPE